MPDQQLITFNITDASIAELKSRYIDFSEVKFGDTAGEKELKSAIASIRTLRVEVEERRKELKADAIEWGRKVDAKAKSITAELLKIEHPLTLNKDKLEAERERIKQQKIKQEQERIDKIRASISELRNVAIKASRLSLFEIVELDESLTDYQLDQLKYQEFFSEANQILHDNIKIIKELRAIKEAEKIEQDKRQAEDARLKIERDKIAAERAELAKEKEILIAKQHKFTELNNKVEEGKIRIEKKSFPLEQSLYSPPVIDLNTSHRVAPSDQDAELASLEINKIIQCIEKFISSLPAVKSKKSLLLIEKIHTSLMVLMGDLDNG